MKRLSQLDDAWATNAAGARLDAVLRAAPALEDTIRSSGCPRRVRTFDVASFPYPTEYAFAGVCGVPVPYVWLQNRALFVEYVDFEGVLRRLLVNPSDAEANKKAPFFRSLFERVPRSLEGTFEKMMSTRAAPVHEQLAAADIDPRSIDFLTFDHLHVQDIRALLPAPYESAKLLVTARELACTRSLHPLQRFWYVDNGLDGIAEDRFAAFEGDVLLGEGVALVRTPGHTEGNHTIVLAMPEGLVTISENGVAADAYAPLHSEIPGLRAHAERRDVDVVLNANTREQTLNQYTSMRLEALLARRDDAPCPRHFCSSELIPSALAPMVKPTWSVGALTLG